MEGGVQRTPEYGELVAEQHVPGMEVCENNVYWCICKPNTMVTYK